MKAKGPLSDAGGKIDRCGHGFRCISHPSRGKERRIHPGGEELKRAGRLGRSVSRESVGEAHHSGPDVHIQLQINLKISASPTKKVEKRLRSISQYEFNKK